MMTKGIPQPFHDYQRSSDHLNFRLPWFWFCRKIAIFGKEWCIKLHVGRDFLHQFLTVKVSERMDGHEHYKNSNLLTKKLFVCQYIFVWKVFPSVGFMTSSENVHGDEIWDAREREEIPRVGPGSSQHWGLPRDDLRSDHSQPSPVTGNHLMDKD